MVYTGKLVFNELTSNIQVQTPELSRDQNAATFESSPREAMARKYGERNMPSLVLYRNTKQLCQLI